MEDAPATASSDSSATVDVAAPTTTVQATPAPPPAAVTTLNPEERKAILEKQEKAVQQLKLCVYGFGKYSNKNQIKKFLNANNVNFVNVKKVRGQELAFVGFDSLDSRSAASEQLKGLRFKKQSLEVSDAKPRKIKVPQKRSLHYGNRNGEDAKRLNKDGESAQPKTIHDQVTPLANTPYDEQLKNKHAVGTTNMVRMIRRIRKKYIQLNKKMNGGGQRRGRQQQKAPPSGADKNRPMEATSPYDLSWVFRGEKAFPVEPIISCKVNEGYRNKCSYTIGRNDKGETEVGFRMGGFHSASGAIVVDPSDCKNVSNLDRPCLVAVKKYLTCGAESGGTELAPFDAVAHVGFWQSLLVRHSWRTGEFMLAFTVCTVGFTEEQLKQEDQRLVSFLQQHVGTLEAENQVGEKREFKLVSVQMRHHTDAQRASGDFGSFHTIFGRGYIEEIMLGLRFRVSAEAFFQVNTRCAEKLFERVGRWVLEGPEGTPAPEAGTGETTDTASDTLLLDICCGTGVIGLTLAKNAKKVVGLELIPEAVEDAKQNAELNNIANAEFHAGRAEKTLRDVLRDTSGFGSIVGIVDPPRSGLHHDVIRALRKCEKLEHLIYVSCNPAGTLLENAVALCAPINESSNSQRKAHGLPFRPVRAVPVDLFPHTDHCEMVVVFSRMERRKQEPTEPSSAVDTDAPASAAKENEAGATPSEATSAKLASSAGSDTQAASE